MEINTALLSTVLLYTIARTSGYREFQDYIPNARLVPHPCKVNYIWWGVGHENPAGGGARNPFGRDFEANGKVWNECLCRADSDGDGLTNGEELGDPNCLFEPGASPEITTGLSHPGVCEPLNDPKCIELNTLEIDCEVSDKLVCPALEREGVLNITMAMPKTEVPAKETTYVCQAFDLPEDKNYSIIAMEPYQDNRNVLHHMIVYGCPDDKREGAKEKYPAPTEEGCMQAIDYCNSMLFAWGLGFSGKCMGDEYGFEMGVTGFKTVILETHWNNPMERDDYFDASGVTFHYTTDLRPNAAGNFFVGPYVLAIPPKQLNYLQSSECPPENTRYMFGTDTVQVISFAPHMHYKGRYMKVEVTRGDTGDVEEWITEENFNYDSPTETPFDTPLSLRGGDIINVTCGYVTTQASNYTFWGYATSDEMCLAVLTYYPLLPTVAECLCVGEFCFVGVQYSVNGGPHSACQPNALPEFYQNITAIYNHLLSICDPVGLECFEECEEALDSLAAQMPQCFTGWTRMSVYQQLLENAADFPDINTGLMVQLLASCTEGKTPPVTVQPPKEAPSVLLCACPGHPKLSVIICILAAAAVHFFKEH